MCSPIRILVSESADVKAITSATALKSVVSPQVMTLQSAECAVMLWSRRNADAGVIFDIYLA